MFWSCPSKLQNNRRNSRIGRPDGKAHNEHFGDSLCPFNDLPLFPIGAIASFAETTPNPIAQSKRQCMKTPPRFIILDDDIFTLAIELNIVRNYCRQSEVISFSSSKEAIKFMEADCCKRSYPDTIFLTDLHMPDIDGFELLERMEKTFNKRMDQLYTFVLSGAASLDEINRVLSNTCVAGFYRKPLSTDKLSHIITCVEYPL
jgi:CheY-like chemotaxis protein